MKVIFLDIDGVLNSRKSMIAKRFAGVPLQFVMLPAKCHVKQLCYILQKTDAKLVISSTWRKHYTVHLLSEIFYLCGMRDFDIIGFTPELFGKQRGTEIQSWLNANKNVYDIENFVILDDDSDMGKLRPHLIKTSFESGLTHNDANRAIDFLNLNVLKTYIKRIDKLGDRNG